MNARHFFACRFPAVPEKNLLCVGLSIDDAAAWLAALRPVAAEDELQQAKRFVHAIDAARHLAGRALVRGVLQNTFGRGVATAFCRTPQGKPFCPNAPMEFSISHSGTMVWAAFCREAAVGIDVEEIRSMPDIAELAAQLHPEECAALRALPPNMLELGFYRCWTRKEAVLKALGTGLTQPLDSFKVQTGPESKTWVISPSGAWTSSDVAALPGYQCSVAARASGLEVRVCIL